MKFLRRIREVLGCHVPNQPPHYVEVMKGGRRILEARAVCRSCDKEIWRDRGNGWQLVENKRTL